VLSCIIAYSSAIAAPFVFDDIPAIDRNPSIRQLTPISVPLQPPRDTPVAGRPVVNLTLAVNYAVNDLLGIAQDPPAVDPLRTVSYHVLNILIHCASGLLLFGILRRTVTRFDTGELDSDRVAGVATLLWLLHPIQTESVDYTVQRTELLVSWFYLLTLYCSIRVWQDDKPNRRRLWVLLAVVACAAGMGSKEVMITAPLVVALYDRTFFSRSWSEVLSDRARRALYAGLAATTSIVIVYVAAGVRTHSVGFHLGVTWHQYLFTQAWAVTRYLRLLVWPVGLTLDYGDAPVGGARALFGALILSLCFVGIVAAWRRRAWQWLAFAGAWFFIILLPSSSVIPIKTEIAAERRVYLASASLFAAAVIVTSAAIRRKTKLGPTTASRLAAAIVVVCGVWTFGRGLTFRSQETLYADVVAKAPNNPRGYVGLGLAHAQRGRAQLPEAAVLFREAIAVDSNSFPAWQSLGVVSVLDGNWREAVQAFREVFRLEPGNLDAAAGMARAEVHLGEPDSAARYVARIGNADPEALWMLGEELIALHRSREALPYLERSATAMPTGRGAALLSVGDAELGDTTGAIQAAKFAVENSGESTDTYILAARAMRLINRTSDAEIYLSRALELDSTLAGARAELDSLRRR
jgi:tetratricopeptide (TPR) repeat protein